MKLFEKYYQIVKIFEKNKNYTRVNISDFNIKFKHKVTSRYVVLKYRTFNIEINFLDESERLDRKNGPAVITLNSNGIIIRKIWCCENYYNRDDGPTIVSYYENGSIEGEHWYSQDELHRKGNPAITNYWQNGNKMTEMWYLNDELHREDGAAIIMFDRNGVIMNKQYFLKGKEIDELQFLVYTGSKVESI